VRALPPPGKRSVRLPEVVLGVLLVAGCAFGAVAWQRATNSTTTVVVASRHIARGSVIGVDDLRGAQVGGETGAMIAGADARLLLGKVAVVDIDAAVPLTPTLISDAAPLGIEEALSSVALDPGQFPPDLAAGDRVRIVVTSTSGVGGAVTATLIDEVAAVWAVDVAADGRTTVVTMRGPIEIGTAVATAEQVRVLRVEGS
jgi:flagella basal body P-ring formation protein FlgA